MGQVEGLADCELRECLESCGGTKRLQVLPFHAPSRTHSLMKPTGRMAAPRVARGPRRCRRRILVLDQAATKKAAGMREARPAATAAAPPQFGHKHAISAATEWTREDSNPAFSLQARCASGLHHGPVHGAERRVQAPAVRPVLFWQHSTQRPQGTCSRGGSPLHPFPGERHGPVRRSSSSRAVSFRCGCRASRRPGLRRAALRCGAGTFLSDRAGSPSAAHGLLDSKMM